MITYKPRVIPVLLLKNRGLVKTRQFKDPVYVGNPTNAVRVFNEKYVQEIVLLDIETSKGGNAPDYSSLEFISSEAFFPLAYGGGVQSVEVALKTLHLGFEKVVLNTTAIEHPSLIRDISSVTGRQSLVVCVNVIKTITGGYRVYAHKTGKKTNLDLIDYIEQIEALGAGEIILQSVNLDGTMKGYDTTVINLVSSLVSIPVIALGGAKGIPDFVSAIKAGASAVAAGTMFVFHGPHRAVLISYPSRDELKREFYQKI